ncbi:hypothetical protein B0H13DRAFT_2278144 [Mycena leptocephala]|nr:hypothetical protein B0H13DRAFT_2278144 [Mycena leptocephala]
MVVDPSSATTIVGTTSEWWTSECLSHHELEQNDVTRARVQRYAKKTGCVDEILHIRLQREPTRPRMPAINISIAQHASESVAYRISIITIRACYNRSNYARPPCPRAALSRISYRDRHASRIHPTLRTPAFTSSLQHDERSSGELDTFQRAGPSNRRVLLCSCLSFVENEREVWSPWLFSLIFACDLHNRIVQIATAYNLWQLFSGFGDDMDILDSALENTKYGPGLRSSSISIQFQFPRSTAARSATGVDYLL